MCFHCGLHFCRAFAKNWIEKEQTFDDIYNVTRTKEMIAQLTQKLEDPERCYAMNWREGDFGIIDNLAIGHFASEDT